MCEDSVLKKKNRKGVVFKKRLGVLGNYFLFLGELYNFVFMKVFKSLKFQIFEIKYFRFFVIFFERIGFVFD